MISIGGNLMFLLPMLFCKIWLSGTKFIQVTSTKKSLFLIFCENIWKNYHKFVFIFFSLYLDTVRTSHTFHCNIFVLNQFVIDISFSRIYIFYLFLRFKKSYLYDLDLWSLWLEFVVIIIWIPFWKCMDVVIVSAF